MSKQSRDKKKKEAQQMSGKNSNRITDDTSQKTKQGTQDNQNNMD